MTIKIGIVGSRDRGTHEDFAKINRALLVVMDKLIEIEDSHKPKYGEVFLVSGGCRYGADWYASNLAEDLGIPMITYYAEWKALGKKAGPIRNTLIAKESDILIACPSDNSKGTVDTIAKFKKFHPDGELILV